MSRVAGRSTTIVAVTFLSLSISSFTLDPAEFDRVQGDGQRVLRRHGDSLIWTALFWLVPWAGPFCRFCRRLGHERGSHAGRELPATPPEPRTWTQFENSRHRSRSWPRPAPTCSRPVRCGYWWCRTRSRPRCAPSVNDRGRGFGIHFRSDGRGGLILRRLAGLLPGGGRSRIAHLAVVVRRQLRQRIGGVG